MMIQIGRPIGYLMMTGNFDHNLYKHFCSFFFFFFFCRSLYCIKFHRILPMHFLVVCDSWIMIVKKRLHSRQLNIDEIQMSIFRKCIGNL